MFNNRRMLLSVCILFVICLFFTACSGGKEEVPTEPPVETTARVSNIYITQDGVVADYFSEPTQITEIVTQPQMQPTAPPVTQTTVPVTQAPSTTLPAAPSASTLTSEQVLGVIKDSINNMKAQTDFSAHLLQQVTINLTDCTFSWAVPIINTAIGVFNGPHNFDYTFTNGIGPDPKEDFKSNVTPYDAIPPSSRLFSLEPSGVVAYDSYQENGETVYTVTIVSEHTDAEVSVPYHHANALDYLDLADFDFGIGEITDSNCNYPGATVTVHIDGNGRLTKYEQNIPMNGSGTGKLGISLSASFEGEMYECWTFSY